jgi:hypothetical protein
MHSKTLHPHGRRLRTGMLILVAVLICLAGLTLVLAFAEEHLNFRDPYTGQETDEEISTIHYDLTYVLALAAGFPIADAITLQVWDQLVDSEEVGPGEAISYTNCLGAFYAPPNSIAPAVCGQHYALTAWPRWDSMKNQATCATSRFGPYSPFFHFPREQDLDAMRDWAWGATEDLIGYEAYAWGGATVMNATCLYTRTAVITMGIERGSLEALATYLHSLADFYSHRDCMAAMDALGMPWATHTVPPIDPDVPECNYNPKNPSNDDVHGQEFGTRYPDDSARTDEAIQAVYSEMLTWGKKRKGHMSPLGMGDVLRWVPGAPTLGEALYAFVHNWEYNQPEQRRAYADLLAEAILVQRNPERLFLPAVMR